MCSKGVSVWFACKLCKSFFLNADDFAYHKKKSHAQEFGNTKFIVFEEQTSPPTSPPENWVSFLSPKEETRIHKIISSPSSTTTTNVDCTPSNESIQSNRNKEFIEIDLETNKVVFIFNDKGNSSKDEIESSTTLMVEPNCRFSSSDDDVDEAVYVQENERLQNSVAPPITGANLTAKKGDKLCSSRNKPALKSKTNTLKRTTQNIQNVASKNALLQTVIQSPTNPYVCLPRLNFRTIRNASSHSDSNSTTNSQETDESDTNHATSNSKTAKQPKIKGADQENIYTSNDALITSPPLTPIPVGSCKFCSNYFNSTAELDIHEEDLCHLRRQSENILCVPCLLKFDSSNELNAHNLTSHPTYISTLTPVSETTTGQRTELSDDLEVALTNEITLDCISSICKSSSSLTNLTLSKNYGDLGSNIGFDAVSNLDNHDDDADLGIDVVEVSEEAINSNQNRERHFVFTSPNLIPIPITEVNLDYGHGDDDLMEVVKEEFVIDESENDEGSEFPNEDHNPIESESREELVAEETFNVALPPLNKLQQVTLTGLNCLSCNKYFSLVKDLQEHCKINHKTQDGKKIFECPYSSCRKTTRNQGHLKSHLSQVHSNVRPYKCPYPNCTQYFKTGTNRNKHFKRHTPNALKS